MNSAGRSIRLSIDDSIIFRDPLSLYAMPIHGGATPTAPPNPGSWRAHCEGGWHFQNGIKTVSNSAVTQQLADTTVWTLAFHNTR